MRNATGTFKTFSVNVLSDVNRGGVRGALTKWRVCLIALFLLIVVCPASAATDPCQSIRDQINSLRTQQRNAESDFQDDSGERGSRKPMASAINRVRREFQQRIDAKEREYDQCRLNHGGKPDEPVTFTGTATMTTTNQNAAGPFVLAVTIDIKFLKYDHKKLEITNFPSIATAPFSTPFGSNTTTITLLSVESATANPSTGKLTLAMTLHFKHSLQAAGGSDLPITVSTDNSGGSRINQGTRHVTLTGTGTFTGGFLGGSKGTLVIDGTLSDLP